jgi:putative FmdB family regulatory protein
MPIYQYRCLNCKKRFEVYFSFNDYGTKPVHCTHCSSANVQRRIGRIRIARSDDSRMDDMMDPGALEGLEDDPREMGRMMRRMSSEMGEELGPEFDEVVDRLEAGQSPEDIEQALPDLGAEEGMGGGGFDDY